MHDHIWVRDVWFTIILIKLSGSALICFWSFKREWSSKTANKIISWRRVSYSNYLCTSWEKTCDTMDDRCVVLWNHQIWFSHNNMSTQFLVNSRHIYILVLVSPHAAVLHNVVSLKFSPQNPMKTSLFFDIPWLAASDHISLLRIMWTKYLR